jgi:hypothetical protein
MSRKPPTRLNAIPGHVSVGFFADGFPILHPLTPELLPVMIVLAPEYLKLEWKRI